MIFDMIRGIIAAQTSREAHTITMDSKIKQDLGVDSLQIFEIVMELEDTFQLEIPTEDLDEITHVSDLVGYIESRRRNNE
ncbi:acyl carrier protein [Dehalobacter sp. DCM]|uniref:acyl carrier protein n=1 Tax=Dehalobacter sp. DCM TaxID=2907827 RepID=UPI003081BC98|nr:acyl carrier protein [Dehalobacter sp. DCM]